MSEIERHAEIWGADFADGKKGGADIGEQRMGAGLIGFVFDADGDIGVMGGDLGEAGDFERPELAVIGSESMVEAILAEPDGHQIAAALSEGINSALGEVDGPPPHHGVWVGEGAGTVSGIAVVAHGEAIQGEAKIGGLFRDLLRRFAAEMIGIVEIDPRETLNGGGARHKLAGAGLSRSGRPEQVRPRGE
jgi:hypothetical protein